MQPASTRVLAIRHGETAWNVDTRMQGQLDIPLNDHGRWQARCVAEALAGEDVTAIYSSDLLRALDTARAIALPHELEVRIDSGLRERAFGHFEGLTYLEIAERWPLEGERWRRRDPEFAPRDGGESLRDFFERCVNACRRIAAAHAGHTIVIVAHGGVMDCLYRAAAHIELQASRSWVLGNASINRLLHSEAGFSLIGWNDHMHLEDESRDEGGEGAASH